MHFRYPRLALLCLSFAAAYLLLRLGVFDLLPQVLQGNGYLSAFLGGMLLSFGFTAPFGLGILVAIAPEVNLLPAACLAAAGAVTADVTLFTFVRCSLQKELEHLSMTSFAYRIRVLFRHRALSERFRLYLLWALGGILIASPLPDELGVMMLSGSSLIEGRRFAAFCFILNFIGAVIILELAKVM